MGLIKETQAMRDLNDCMGSLSEKSREIRRLTAAGSRLEGALALAIVNKDRAEDQERLARVEIDRLNALLVDARSRFDDIANSASTLQQENNNG